jgi:hypothetical protein
MRRDILSRRLPRGRAAQTRRLLLAMAPRAGRWWITAGFQCDDFLTVDGERWTVNYKIHLAPVSWPDVTLASSVTLWPPKRTKVGRSAGTREWRRQVTDALARFGYQGDWPKGPDGVPFGDFWRSHASASSALAEVDFFGRIANRRRLFPRDGVTLVARPLRR